MVPLTIQQALDRFMKSAGLRSRSAAVAEALSQWAEDFQRETRVAEAVSRYGSAYARDAALEVDRAASNLKLLGSARKRGR